MRFIIIITKARYEKLQHKTSKNDLENAADFHENTHTNLSTYLYAN